MTPSLYDFRDLLAVDILGALAQAFLPAWSASWMHPLQAASRRRQSGRTPNHMAHRSAHASIRMTTARLPVRLGRCRTSGGCSAALWHSLRISRSHPTPCARAGVPDRRISSLPSASSPSVVPANTSHPLVRTTKDLARRSKYRRSTGLKSRNYMHFSFGRFRPTVARHHFSAALLTLLSGVARLPQSALRMPTSRASLRKQAADSRCLPPKSALCGARRSCSTHRLTRSAATPPTTSRRDLTR